MPDQEPPNTESKSRLRGDMYLRAEQRRIAELRAELTGIETPPDAAVSHPEAAAVSPAVSAHPVGPPPFALAVPVARPSGPPPEPEDGAIEPAAAAAPADEPVITTASATRPVTPPTPVAAPAAAPVRLPNPVWTPAAPRPRRRHARRSAAPAAVLGAIVILAAMGVVVLLWPADMSAPSVADAPAPVQPVRAAPVVPAGGAAAEVAAGDRVREQPEPADDPADAREQPAPAVAAARQEAPPARPLASEGRLRVTSTPAGARVTVNGIGWGQTPLTVENLPLGTKTLRVTRDGYASQQRIIDLRGDQPSASVHMTLRRDQTN